MVYPGMVMHRILSTILLGALCAALGISDASASPSSGNTNQCEAKLNKLAAAEELVKALEAKIVRTEEQRDVRVPQQYARARQKIEEKITSARGKLAAAVAACNPGGVTPAPACPRADRIRAAIERLEARITALRRSEAGRIAALLGKLERLAKRLIEARDAVTTLQADIEARGCTPPPGQGS